MAPPPPGINQVQYQIHAAQRIPLQVLPPRPPTAGSQNSAQPMTQMYVVTYCS